MKCSYCDGKGKIEVPVNQTEFDREFERLDKVGSLSMGECRRKALEESGYTWKNCPMCHGTGEER